jgi:hypothetical protein
MRGHHDWPDLWGYRKLGGAVAVTLAHASDVRSFTIQLRG